MELSAPKCGNTDQFNVQGCAYFTDVTDDGTGEYEEVNFAYPFMAQCCACKHEGPWGTFNGFDSWECEDCGEAAEFGVLLVDNQLEERCPSCGSSDIKYIKKANT